MKGSKGLFSANGGQQSNTNNYAQMLIQAQEQKNLANKLLKIKPSVDNREPIKYSHLNHNRGLNQINRQKQIDQENSLLLKRMLTIIKRKNYSCRDNQFGFLQPSNNSIQAPLSSTTGGQPSLNLAEHIMMPINTKDIPVNLSLNNHGQQSIQQQSNFMQNPQVISLHPLSGTMNYFQRKKEYEHIQNSNMQLVRAIRDSKPALKRQDWKEHIKQYERLKSQLNKRRPLTKSTTGMLTGTTVNGVFPSVMQQKSMSQASERRLQSNLNHRNGIDGININESLSGRGPAISSTQTWGDAEHNNRLLREAQEQADDLVVQNSLNKSHDNIRQYRKSNVNQSLGAKSIDQTANRIRRNADNLRQNSHNIGSVINKTGEQRRSSANPDIQNHLLMYGSPKKQNYYQNLLQSPLLNFSQFPQSILKRITTRGATAEQPTRRRDVPQNFFPISQREEQQYLLLNDQEANTKETPDAVYQALNEKEQVIKVVHDK